MITGYSDRLSARPRQTIRFMVSTNTNSVELVLVQLHRGGPDLLETALGGNTMATIPGREQPLCPGSYGLVEDWDFADGEDSSFTIGVWSFPTLLNLNRKLFWQQKTVWNLALLIMGLCISGLGTPNSGY